MAPPWTDAYIGLPFKEHGRDRSGLDCWGLVRLVLAERFGLELPSFGEAYRGLRDREAIAAAVEAERPTWAPVVVGHETAGDVPLFRMRGAPLHVGVVVRPPLMVHIQRGTGSALEDYRGLRWRDRLLGVYRHPQMALPQCSTAAQ